MQQPSPVPETAPATLPQTQAVAAQPGTQSDPIITAKLDQVLAAIELSRVSMEERLGSITTDISLLRDDQRKLADRVKEGECSSPRCTLTKNQYKTSKIASPPWRTVWMI